MFEKRLWGDTPAGFKRLRPKPTWMAMVRQDQEGDLAERFSRPRESKEESSSLQGRARLQLFRLKDGGTALVRAYRHGGLLRHLTGELFFTWPPRPFRELAITEEVRRRGVPTVEILAAWVEIIGGPFYRGWLVTRELQGAHDLWAALRGGLTSSHGRSLLQAVARSLKRMHHGGVDHGDLNLKNILVRQEMGEMRSYILDFDKARLFPGELPRAKAERNLGRLLRSVSKLDPERRYWSREDWDLFISFYFEAREG